MCSLDRLTGRDVYPYLHPLKLVKLKVLNEIGDHVNNEGVCAWRNSIPPCVG